MLRDTIRSFRFLILLGAVAAVAPASTLYTPAVTYTVSGSANNWTLDFTVVQNIMPPEFSIHALGFLFADGTPVTITGTPNQWNDAPDYNLSAAGVQSGTYQSWIASTNVWLLDPTPNPGTLTGFQLHLATATVPDSIYGFAIAINWRPCFSAQDPGCENETNFPVVISRCNDSENPGDECAFPGTTPGVWESKGVTWDWHADNPNTEGNFQRNEPGWVFTATNAQVPEPSTYLLLSLGFVTMGISRHFSRKK